MPSIPTFLAASIFQADFSRLSKQLYDLQRQTGSGSKADDLQGYGERAGSLINARSLIAENEARMAIGNRLVTRLGMQDIALSQTSDAVRELREGVTTAAISGNVGELRTKLELAFAQVVSSMNAYHEGQPLFAGDRRDTNPVTIGSLDELRAAGDVSTIFAESSREQTVDLGGGIAVKVADRASTISEGLFEAMRDVYQVIRTIPVTQELTTAQKLQLQDLDQDLATAQSVVLGAQGRNGVTQHRLESDIERLQSNNNTVKSYLGDIADADLAEVAVLLSAVQTQYQAAAKVYSQMRDLTLVNFLD